MRELIKFFLLRLKRDEIGIEASSLAYTSILALVPALTVILSIFAMIPAFQPLKEEMMNFATSNFLPVLNESITESVTTFVSHAGSTTITGALMLLIVSLMLIRAIDSSINRIFRGGRRRFGMTFAIYWTMLTVGPLSLGVILWATTRLVAFKFFSDEQMAIAVKTFYYVLPFFIETALMFVVYTAMPVCKVRARDALFGAFVVSILFEITKRLFSIFILNFTDYQAIYGALAAAPVLMIWIYINWWLILIGAELTAILGIARADEAGEVPQAVKSLVRVISNKEAHKPLVDFENPVEHKSSIKVHVSPSRRPNSSDDKEQ